MAKVRETIANLSMEVAASTPQELADGPGKDKLKTQLKNDDLKKHQPIVDAQMAITTRHNDMPGAKLAQ